MVCLENHIQNKSIEEIKNLFTNLLIKLNEIYEKEKEFYCQINKINSQEHNNNNNIPLVTLFTWEKIISNNIHNISKLFKINIKITLEQFKENYIIKEENIINEKTKENLEKLNLIEIYTIIIKNYLKDEIKTKIEEYKNIHDRMILSEILNIANNLYIEWAIKNTKTDGTKFREEFLNYVKKIYLKTKTNQFFDIITNYPESHNSLIDIKRSLSENQREDFIIKIKSQICNRLLTPGVATPLIIEIFIRIIKMLKFLDASSFILEMVSAPIKKYLSQRKDTMRWIITTILSEEDTSIKEDLGKQYIKSNISIFNKEKENEYDNISSDEDEEEAQNWQPLPIVRITSTKGKFSDIISTLVNIFGSPEKFVEQYKKMLAERCVSDTKFSLENEIKNLELLKIKFGENLMQGLDIIIKDVTDSNKLNSIIKSNINLNNPPIQNTNKNDFELNCLIINKNFWPFKDDPVFSLELENENLNLNMNLNNLSNINNSNCNLNNSTFDNFLRNLNNKFQIYKQNFSKIKLSRTLNLFTNIGFVDLTLTFDNGTFYFRVSPLAALVINLFNEIEGDEDLNNEINYENFNFDFISEKLNCSINDAKKKINFWVSKGVLIEVNKNSNNNNLNTMTNFILDDSKRFFIPNKILPITITNNDNNLIIEDEIFQFEYVETETQLNLENAINSIIKNSGPRTFDQIFKNLIISYGVNLNENKLKEVLGKMILEQKLFKEGDFYKLIVLTY